MSQLEVLFCRRGKLGCSSHVEQRTRIGRRGWRLSRAAPAGRGGSWHFVKVTFATTGTVTRTQSRV